MTEIEKVLIKLGENVVEDYFEDIEVGEATKKIILRNILVIKEWREKK